MSAISGFCEKCNKFRKRHCDGNRNTCMSILFDTIEALQQENEQLQAQAALMREALIFTKEKIYEQLSNYVNDPKKFNYSAISIECVQKIVKALADTSDYHNPADVAEIEKLRDELKRYKQAEQEGRLYDLPLKPGDTIYRPEALQFCWMITKVEIYEDEIVFIDDSDNIFRLDDIGKTVFLTKEAAEKALGGGE